MEAANNASEYNAHDFYIEHSTYTDLRILTLGEEECLPGHSYGPAVREYYLLHFVMGGRGRFSVDGRDYPLGSGQAFLIFPEIVTHYAADVGDPWVYKWIGFDGIFAWEYIKRMGLSRENPIYTPGLGSDGAASEIEGLLTNMRNYGASPARLAGAAHTLFGVLMENADGKGRARVGDMKSKYVENAVNYITYNYWKNIRITQLAEMNNLDRSYFCRIFKEETGRSPQEFLIRYRMNLGARLLGNPSLSVSDCARSVGYDDQLAFSKLFKKIMGVSPSEYREVPRSGLGTVQK